MRTIRFNTEFETADMVVRLQMAGAKFQTIGRVEIMVEDNEPALVLPPTFVQMLRDRMSEKGIHLMGAVKIGRGISLLTSNGTICMKGSFSINDVMEKL